MWFPWQKGPSGFSARSTAEDVTQGIDASALTAIITGASSGIGAETARVLAMRGVHVIIAMRNVNAGNKVKGEIPKAKIQVMELDLSSLASVRKFASNFNSLALPLNILVNKQVNVSSMGHKFANKGIDFEQISDKSSYFAGYSYCYSKLANILHANELTKRLKEEEEEVNITINSLHPGSIATNIMRHHKYWNWLFQIIVKCFFKSMEQGAATQCYVALNPQVEGVSGEYFCDSNIAKPHAHCYNTDLAKKLWEISEFLRADDILLQVGLDTRIEATEFSDRIRLLKTVYEAPS